MLTRRQAIKAAALTAAACATSGDNSRLLAQATPAATAVVAAPPGAPFKLPPLPYAYDALEPYLDTLTMQVHHDRHHAAYVANLNKALAGYADLAKQPVEELLRKFASLPVQVQTAVRNQGGGHANHSFLWPMMAKKERQHPRGQLNLALEKRWGTFEQFKQTFSEAAASVFGSGWAWLTMGGNTKLLRIETTPNQDSPLLYGRTPLIGIDLWEHAYYLKYQNKRPEYIANFYNVINWEWVESRYEQANG